MATKSKAKPVPGHQETFPVSKGVLRVEGDLYWEHIEEFDSACAKLLESRMQRLEIDLHAVNFISSSYVGCLANLVLRASRRRKRVILKVSEDVSWLFDMVDGGRLFDLEVA